MEVARKEFKELIETYKEIREKEILDYQNEDLPNKTDKKGESSESDKEIIKREKKKL